MVLPTVKAQMMEGREKPQLASWSNFFCSHGRKHWDYTVCQQDRRKPRLLFSFSLFSLSWAFHRRQGQMISQMSSQLYHSVFPSLRQLSNPCESITCRQAWSSTQAHISFWFPAQSAQTPSVNKWAIPGASHCCHQTQTAFVLLALKMPKQSKNLFQWCRRTCQPGAQSIRPMVFLNWNRLHFAKEFMWIYPASSFLLCQAWFSWKNEDSPSSPSVPN